MPGPTTIFCATLTLSSSDFGNSQVSGEGRVNNATGGAGWVDDERYLAAKWTLVTDFVSD